MKLTELFRQGKFVITSEVGPVKGCSRVNGGPPPEFIQEAVNIKDFVDAVNVTDNQSAVMRLGSLAASVLLKQQGIEPIFQMTCRDRNRLALQSDLLSACTLGIDNVLCLTGDHIKLGDHVASKPVFDIDSVHLLHIARGLNQGRDMMGNPLSRATDLALGAVVNPNFEPLDLQIMKMEKKIEQGAEFFQTQAVYDPKVFETFVRRAEGFRVPIQYGLVVIKSPKMAQYMNEHVSGITVPEALIKEMASVPADGYKAKAQEITLRLARELGTMVQGIHFMPLGWSELVPPVVTELRKLGK
uniref:Methylenetetrahydrofolate reductase n=1 Tax=Desulfobacca acetoxidans TaxID=60893 RepID=A0A7V4G9X5_9BACT